MCLIRKSILTIIIVMVVVSITQAVEDIILPVKEYIVISPRLIPDWNHDRKIDIDDENQATASNPYRFWVNNDNDNPFSGSDGNDCPISSGTVDSFDLMIDGIRDLVDFFPVKVDIRETLALLPAAEYNYILKHKTSSFYFHEVGLTPLASGFYLYKTSVAEQTKRAMQKTITSTGVALSTEFLASITAVDQSIILIEARSSTDKPIKLEIQRKSDNQVVYSGDLLHISTSSVEDMYRYLNLRNDAGDLSGGLSRRGEPDNNPDSLSNNKHVVFIHGYNEDAEAGRGNIAEIFKRLYWSGSKAKFTGVAWYGDESITTEFHANVINAFQTSPGLAVYLNELKNLNNEEVNVIAFSLGNMLVSSAISDHSASVDRYFMLHAAVAKEAYDAEEFDEGMIQSQWRDYTNRVYASKWCELFPQGDGRHSLSWTGRFSSVVGPQVYNFYSSGENVLENLHDGGVGFGIFWDNILLHQEYVWCVQELWKGRHESFIGGSDYGGWRFSMLYFNELVNFNPAAAAELTPVTLRVHPFFDSSSPVSSLLQDPENPNGSGSQFATANRGRLLAEMIPAMSFAVGADDLDKLGVGGNFDMNTLYKNGWPAERLSDWSNGRWLHGDYNTVEYVYVYGVFDEIINIGGFDQ